MTVHELEDHLTHRTQLFLSALFWQLIHQLIHQKLQLQQLGMNTMTLYQTRCLVHVLTHHEQYET